MSDIDKLRDYYDTTDLTDQIADAEWTTETEDHPMIGITVRMPRDVLQQVRRMAANKNMKPTALIRQWVEDEVAHPQPRTAPLGSVLITSSGGLTKADAIAKSRRMKIERRRCSRATKAVPGHGGIKVDHIA